MPLSDEARIIDRERRYMERLLLSRFNFYLVFIALFLAAHFDPHLEAHASDKYVLVVGAIVSFLMSLAVTRTAAFVSLILDEIETKHRDHPFARLSRLNRESASTWSYLVLQWPRAYWYHVVVTWFVTIYCLLRLDLSTKWWVSIGLAAAIGIVMCMFWPRKAPQSGASRAEWSDPTA
jgi:hypothetical protein